MRFTPDQRLQQGRYTIDRALARGGMGEVYLVIEHHQTLSDRTRILKVMLDYFDPTNPQAVKAARIRFEQEARTLSKLTFRGIPDIKDFFEEGRDAGIVMEYIEGQIWSRS